MKFFIRVVAIIVALFFLYFIYLKVTYIDEEVRVGDAYGYSIGDSKDDVYLESRVLYAGKEVFIRYPIGSDGYGPLNKFKFSVEEYKKIASRETWKFYFGKMDFISLGFENGELVSIYRHRQYFDTP